MISIQISASVLYVPLLKQQQRIRIEIQGKYFVIDNKSNQSIENETSRGGVVAGLPRNSSAMARGFLSFSRDHFARGPRHAEAM